MGLKFGAGEGRGLDPVAGQRAGWAEVRGGSGAGPGAGCGARGGAWAAACEPNRRPSPAEARAHPSVPEPAAPARGDGAGARRGGRCASAAEEGGAAAQGVQLREPQVPRPGRGAAGRGGSGEPATWWVGDVLGGPRAARPRRGKGSLRGLRGSGEEPGPSGRGSREGWAVGASGAGGGRPREEPESVGNPDPTRGPQSVGAEAGPEQSRAPGGFRTLGNGPCCLL